MLAVLLVLLSIYFISVIDALKEKVESLEEEVENIKNELNDVRTDLDGKEDLEEKSEDELMAEFESDNTIKHAWDKKSKKKN